MPCAAERCLTTPGWCRFADDAAAGGHAGAADTDVGATDGHVRASAMGGKGFAAFVRSVGRRVRGFPWPSRGHPLAGVVNMGGRIPCRV